MKTIKSRLIAIITICFAFILVSVFLYCRNIIDLKGKVVLIERFDDLRDNLLELRRYEKNFFLAGDVDSLDMMVVYLEKTDVALGQLGGQIKDIMGTPWYDTYRLVLKNYKNTVEINTARMIEGRARVSRLENLRVYGKELNDYTDELIRVKRHRIEQTLNQMLLIPFVFTIVFFLFSIVFLRVIRNDILDPLKTLTRSAQDIARGSFEPVPVVPDRYDEVSRCLSAFNKMAYEIETRQTQVLQSRKMASIGTFTSGIAHELNNPINNISLIVDGLIEDGAEMTEAERKSLYDDLMVQADRSSEIVKSLLEFSRTDEPCRERLAPDEIVEKTLRLVRNELRLNRIKSDVQVKKPIAPVWMDKNRLQQALLNLMINAIQAMPRGGQLTIILSMQKDDGQMRIDVMDTGVGIAEDQLDLIFDPFFTTKKEGKGTGLGLSVTYGIIQKNGGRITVESKAGQGTCFSVFLPMADSVGMNHE